MILELGGGKNPKDCTNINIDKRHFTSVDIIYNLENGIPLEDKSVNKIFVFHILEHIQNLEYFMEEIHRVSKNNAKIVGEVPYYKDKNAYTDPTHTNFFTLDTFDYWDSSTDLGQFSYFNNEFIVISTKLKRRYKYRFWKKLGPIQFKLKVNK